MNKTLKQSVMAVFGFALMLCATLAQAQAANSVYVIDARGQVATNSTGLCWRTGFWTPAAAAQDPNGCKCDKDLIAKDICEPKPAPAPAAAPTPAPARPAAPAPAPAAFGEKVTIAADALFDFNKATLRPEGRTKLDAVVAQSNNLVLEVIIAVGHADRIGSASYNQKLSEKRAAAVKDYLVSKGIPANRIYTEGKGSKQPVTKAGECKGPKSPKVIACLQPDRRVDIEMIGTKKR